jgi:asparagine synthase (glutamine-hydrolysing)
MCGICGHLTPDREQPVDRQLLVRMNNILIHRGPDDEGYYINGNMGMAMRRLAIIDVAGGQQPIYSENGSIAVVFNGEIYNFRELRAELGKFGHKFSTQSDTEVIVHAYEQWEDEALLRFNGMFAIALWDESKQRLLLARDRMGKKPLYWHHSKYGLLWGSEAKALLAAPWVERKVNPVALHHYLTLQYIPDPLTIFQGMYKLPAAHKLVIKPGSGPNISRWWQLEFEPKWEISEAGVIEEARTLLEAAVERRLISEVPLGAFLSGGIDSSIVVSLMAEKSSEPVNTFSIGYTERHFSELDYARQIAERYHTDHHEFIFRPDDLASLIEHVVSATDEPLADPAALPLFELARQTRQYVTVALCGDGGDETVAGYRRYALDGLLQFYSRLPDSITQKVVPAFAALLPEPTWLPQDRNPVTGFKRLSQFSATTEKASLVRWGSYFSHDDKLALYTDGCREALAQEYTADWIARAFDDAQADSFLDRTLHADHVTYLSGDLLPKTDRVTMAHSLEARAPLLDLEWVEWTARLPPHYKVRGMKTKRLLKSAFPDKLPSSIINRGKAGFSVPVGQWLRYELRDWARSRLLENRNLSKYIWPAAINRLFDEHDSGQINRGKRLWALLIFAVWQEMYLVDQN